MNLNLLVAPYLRQLIAGTKPETGLGSRDIHVGFVVHKVAF
jgi:hypothetical protein